MSRTTHLLSPSVHPVEIYSTELTGNWLGMDLFGFATDRILREPEEAKESPTGSGPWDVQTLFTIYEVQYLVVQYVGSIVTLQYKKMGIWILRIP